MLEVNGVSDLLLYYWQSFFYLSVNNVFGNIFSNDNLSQNSSKTIEDVPVEIIYNSKIYM